MEPRAYGPFPYLPITERPELKWPGGFSLAELAGNRIRLKFELRAAKLYSFLL